ncbi:P68 family surface lipoprotein [Mycoplasmopsis edwardii]|nr:hypothetical protein [Mycoplasmopsis edwardii]
MKNKFKIISSLLALAALPIASLSCSPNEKQQKQISYPTTEAIDNEIVFTAAQSGVYPLMIALKQIIPLYNETMNGHKDYVPVKLVTQNENNASSELELGVQQANYIKENSKNVANIILGNQGTAYLVNQYDKLLNVSSVIKSQDFLDKVLNTHTKLVGEDVNSKKIFNLPFNITDIDALSINLDLLAKLFEILETANAKIDKSSKLYQKVQASRNQGNEIPTDSIIHFVKVKENNKLSQLTINDQTFENILDLMNFSKVLLDNLEIDRTKVNAEKYPTRDLAIFSVDYQQDTFFKVLNNKLKGKKLWTLKDSENPYDLSEINYHISSDKDIQKVFIETLDEFIAQNKKLVENKNVLYNVKYENNKNEWASWEIREYRTVFAFAAAVGYEQSIKSPTSVAFFAGGSEEKAAHFATADDVFLQPQLTKNNATDTYTSYCEGGSSLIPVSVDNNGKEDKGTILFLDWLYNGEVEYDGEKIKVRDLLTKKSSYILPLKEKLTTASENWFDTEINKLSAKINHEKALLRNEENAETQGQLKKSIAKHTTEINYLKAGKVSYQSLKTFVKKEDQDFSYLPIDAKSSKIIKLIKDVLEQSTLKENEIKNSGQSVLNNILNIINEK